MKPNGNKNQSNYKDKAKSSGLIKTSKTSEDSDIIVNINEAQSSSKSEFKTKIKFGVVRWINLKSKWRKKEQKQQYEQNNSNVSKTGAVCGKQHQHEQK